MCNSHTRFQQQSGPCSLQQGSSLTTCLDLQQRQTATYISNCLLTIFILLCHWLVICGSHQCVVHTLKRTKLAEPFYTHTSSQAPLSILPILKIESDYSFWVWFKQKRHSGTQTGNGTLTKGNSKFPGSSREQIYNKFPGKGPQWLLCHPVNEGYVLSNKVWISAQWEELFHRCSISAPGAVAII